VKKLIVLVLRFLQARKFYKGECKIQYLKSHRNSARRFLKYIQKYNFKCGCPVLPPTGFEKGLVKEKGKRKGCGVFPVQGWACLSNGWLFPRFEL
jgi:hypothetical protein